MAVGKPRAAFLGEPESPHRLLTAWSAWEQGAPPESLAVSRTESHECP